MSLEAPVPANFADHAGSQRGGGGFRSLVFGTERAWDPRNRAGLAVLLVALVVYLGVRYDNFATTSNAFTILLNVTAIGIAAMGTTFLVTSGNVDLSIGGMYALVSVTTGLVARESQSAPVAVLYAVAVGAALGYMNGRLVRLLKLNPLIVTLAMAAILRGFAYVASDAATVTGFPDALVRIGRQRIGSVPLPVIIGAVIYLIGGVLLLKTVFGLRVYAIGGSATAADLAGVRSRRVVTAIYALNGGLIGVVSVLTIARLGSAQPAIGTGFELYVLTAVMLGGVAFNGGAGHPLGVLIGVAMIGVIDAGIVFAGIPDFWQQIVRGGVLFLALVGDLLASKQRARAGGANVRDPVGSVRLGGSTPARSRPSRDTLPVVLAANDLVKTYGSVRAVRGISFEARAGEVVCLVGDNGAGKSTLIKMMSGAVQPDSGWIELDGARIDLAAPADARRHGIQTVYQDLALCPNLGAAHNLVLGNEPKRTRGGVFALRDDAVAAKVADKSLAELGVRLPDLLNPVSTLSGGQRQAVAIARAATSDVRVVILDEPTAALGVKQTSSVLALVRRLRDRGVAIVFISHSLDTVVDIADRLVVLRHGAVVFDGEATEVGERDLLHLMAGLPVSLPDATPQPAAVRPH